MPQDSKQGGVFIVGLAIFTYPEMDINFVLAIYQLKEKKKISADIINYASSVSRTIRIRKTCT